MNISAPLKKWKVNMMSADYEDEMRIGTLMQMEDFFMFCPARGVKPAEGIRSTIIYPEAGDVKDKIKMDFGWKNKYSLSAVEYFF